jgi:hypothetical protein
LLAISGLRTFEYGDPDAEGSDHYSEKSRDRSRTGTAREHPDERESGSQGRHHQSHRAEEAL